jgi:nicotinamide N-methyltransferase
MNTIQHNTTGNRTEEKQQGTIINNHVQNQEEEEDDDDDQCIMTFVSDMFEEPADFRPQTPPPQTITVVLTKSLYFTVNLIGHHSLWAHCLWNSSKCISHWFAMNNQILRTNVVAPMPNGSPLPDYPYLYRNESLKLEAPIVQGKCVMELGAGGALPSMSCIFMGARRVLSTDFPEKQLLENMEKTFMDNLGEEQYKKLLQNGQIEIRGHLWGNLEELKQRRDCLYDNMGRFLQKIDTDESKGSSTSTTETEKFDIIILSDLIFNTSAHGKMMASVRNCSIPEHTEIYLTYSHHRPHKKDQELEVFKVASSLDIDFELLFIQKYPPMFPDDPYPLEEREKVWMWRGKLKASK